MKNKMMSDIKEILKENEMPYQCDEKEGRISVSFSGNLWAYEVKEDTVECSTIFLECVPGEKRGKVLEYINRINIIGEDGHFELDGEGHPRFRLVRRIIDGQPIDKKQLGNMLKEVIRVEFALMPSVYRVARGEREPEEELVDVIFRLE